MNSNTFSLPARRCAAVAAAVALTAGPVLLAAPAQATGVEGDGSASASVLRTSLDVSLLNKTVDVPLNASLNEVKAPASADKTALSVELDGVDKGKAFSVLRADVATSKATVDEHKAEGYANLAHAKVHVPGLPLLSLIEVQQVTSKAVCAVGEKPTAESNLLGDVTVLGKRVTVSAAWPDTRLRTGSRRGDARPVEDADHVPYGGGDRPRAQRVGQSTEVERRRRPGLPHHRRGDL